MFVLRSAAWRAIACDDAGMRVPDHRHVVVGVEVPPAVGVLHPHALATDEVERTCVGQRLERASEDPSPSLHELLVGSGCRRWAGGGSRGGGQAAGRLVASVASRTLEERPGGLGPAVDVGVVGILPRPQGRDEDGLRHAAREQVAEQVARSRSSSGEHRRVACQEGRGDVEEVMALPEQRLQRRRHVEDQGRVGHVPEVDDPRHATRIVEQQVVEGHVVVDDLRSQPREGGHDARLKPRHDLARGARAAPGR